MAIWVSSRQKAGGGALPHNSFLLSLFRARTHAGRRQLVLHIFWLLLFSSAGKFSICVSQQPQINRTAARALWELFMTKIKFEMLIDAERREFWEISALQKIGIAIVRVRVIWVSLPSWKVHLPSKDKASSALSRQLAQPFNTRGATWPPRNFFFDPSHLPRIYS